VSKSKTKRKPAEPKENSKKKVKATKVKDLSMEASVEVQPEDSSDTTTEPTEE
jgi:hypothetical protein